MKDNQGTNTMAKEQMQKRSKCHGVAKFINRKTQRRRKGKARVKEGNQPPLETTCVPAAPLASTSHDCTRGCAPVGSDNLSHVGEATEVPEVWDCFPKLLLRDSTLDRPHRNTKACAMALGAKHKSPNTFS